MIEESPASLAARALAEDGARDVTSDVTIDPGASGRAVLEVREPLVLAGLAWADAVAAACGLPPVDWQAREGARLGSGAVAGRLEGNLRALLRAERPLLNLLQRASGIATITRQYVDALEGTRCRVLHTRKTAPGLRALDVAAVLAGGGLVHRVDLEAAVMVKDNHWAFLRAHARTLAEALAQARAEGTTRLYVEVETREQLVEACEAGATRLLIDNQTPGIVRAWAAHARRLAPAIEIEATGGLSLTTVRAFADAGADYVSIGALTHSVKASDVAMEIEEGGGVRGEK